MNPDKGTEAAPFTAHGAEIAGLDEQLVQAPAKVAGDGEPVTHVLLVEDNIENLALLRIYVEHLPITLGFASNGREALEERKRANYDLILMDVKMPIMDGHTAIREIRAWEQAHGVARVPAVALTGQALSEEAAGSQQAGWDGHLTKPIRRNELVQAVAKFARHRVRRSAPVLEPGERIAALGPAFLANRRLDLEKMRVALAAGNFQTVESIGHNCKGCGTGYGFPEISMIAATIEKAARALDRNELNESLAQFEHSIQSASVRLSTDIARCASYR